MAEHAGPLGKTLHICRQHHILVNIVSSFLKARLRAQQRDGLRRQDKPTLGEVVDQIGLGPAQRLGLSIGAGKLD